MYLVILALSILGAAICLASLDAVYSKLNQLVLFIGIVISLIAGVSGGGMAWELSEYKAKYPAPVQVGKIMQAPDGTTFTQTLKENE